MDEKELERTVCAQLRTAEQTPRLLGELQLARATCGAKTIADLVNSIPYEVIEDDSRWNPYPHLLVDLTGNTTPDIVLRSSRSGENRIYIEVKKDAPLRYGKADSQVVRYLLHLLSTTHRVPPKIATDITRAIILAAPAAWFSVARNADTWGYFLETFSSLATAFNVFLAELHLQDAEYS